MQTPMTTTLMGKRETVAAFLHRVFLWIEALVDHDAPISDEDRAEDIGIGSRAWHAEQFVGVIELDAELQVLLDDVFDRDRGAIVRPRAFAYSFSKAVASRSIASSER